MRFAISSSALAELGCGNGARQALIDVAETLPTTLDREGAALCWADWILADLWDRGFKVVPLE